MNNVSPFRILIAALLLAVFAGAILPGTAFADEGEPPVTEEPAPPLEDGSEPAAEEPAAEEPTIEEPSASEETPTSDEGDAEATAEEALPDLPEGTELFVLDENGEPLALGSQEAAELIEIIDPIWCPVGVTPGGAGCSGTFASLSDLVAGFVPTGNGVIWIEAGADGGTSVEIDGGVSGNWETARTYTLTIKGGWNGTLGSTTTNPATPSEFDTQISINGWANDVTLSDIVISGYGGYGPLSINTTGKVTLTRVEVSGNTQNGATVDNSGGTKDVVITSSEFNANTGDLNGLHVISSGNITLTSVTVDGNYGGAILDNDGIEGKNVTVTSSTFNDNTDDSGLVVDSKGTITLSSVTANGNGYGGADLNNSTSTFARNVTLTSGVLQFNNNLGGSGLIIYSTGLISLKDVDAIGNLYSGALLDNRDSTTAQGISLTGANIFSNNGTDGISALSEGPITSATALIANSNGGIGAELDNSYGTAKPLTLSGTNEFKFNSDGLVLNSFGIVTLNNLTVTDNTDDGAYINNTVLPGFDVILNGTNTFDRNAGSGLNIDSWGAIKINNLSADDNGQQGASLENTGNTAKPVMLTGTNTANGNGNEGLIIESYGAITIAKLTANDNGGDGAYLKNDFGTTPLAVTITGYAIFDTNYAGYGIEVITDGAVTISNIYAANNFYAGAAIFQSSSGGSGAITINGTSGFASSAGGFYYNGTAGGYDGLYIESQGAVSLTNLDFYGNDGNGLYVDNSYGTAAGNVTLTTTIAGKNIDAVDNNGNGIEIYSEGNISLTRVVATDNTAGSGAILDNSGAAVAKTITIATSGVFSDNFGSGLVINSLGVVTLANITANSNDGFEGALIDTLGTVTLTGTNSFSDNDDDGLLIYTTAAVTTSNLTANNNAGGYGVLIESDTLTPFAVTLNGTNSTTGNGLDGLAISAGGLIKINQLSSTGNQGKGAFIQNQGSTLPQTVTFSGTNVLSFNGGYGLHVLSNGAITINNVTADYNGSSTYPSYDNGSGVFLENTFYGASFPQNVTLTGTNHFDNNFYHGIQVYTYGAIAVNNIHANGNGWGEAFELDRFGIGAILDNCIYDGFFNVCNATTAKPITITGTNSFNSNWSAGLNISTIGNVKINNLDASFNGLTGYPDGYGAIITNNYSTSVGTVSITGHAFTEDNNSFGLRIDALRQITMANLVASGNGLYGATLENGSGTGGVTVTGTTYASNNDSYGLQVNTTGAINLAKLNASGNGTYGADLYNLSGTAGVTITGTAETSNNVTDYGMTIFTRGAILINVIDASGSGNGTYGWSLDNILASPAKTVTLTTATTNSLDFDNNISDFGLQILSLGTITVKNLDASGNGTFGAFLQNHFLGATGAVTITSTNGDSTFSDNANDSGLVIFSNRAISVQNLVANNNSDDGAFLDNTYSGAATGQNVTINGYSITNTNGDNGLIVNSFGAILTNNLTANDNGQNLNALTGWGASLENVGPTLPKSITLNGTNTFNDNYQDGLLATSYGAIKANAISASGNGDDGLHIDNRWGVFTATVALTGSSTFDDNGQYGLLVFSNGAVTLNNIGASYNGDGGAYISNDSLSTALVPVKLTGTNVFWDNEGYGLEVDTDSSISINNLTAGENGTGGDGSHGAYLNNNTGGAVANALRTITLTGINTFYNNAGLGLGFDSLGNVSLGKITADTNEFAGVSGTAGTANITIACGSMTDNGGQGLELTANMITLKGVYSTGNGFADSLTYNSLIVARSC